ncbi:hypothetical protein JW851_04850 [Candidatus Woesearchaeota archaeon]|nr:hypothetical protein [Candidatus Woesearchaeota archaeon]
MKCIKCANSASTCLKHLGGLCNKCFIKTIEKRIRRDLAVNKIFKPHDKILLINDKSLKAELSKYFLQSISKSIPLKIDIKTGKIGKKYNKIIEPKNLDNEIEYFLESVFAKKSCKKPKAIHLLRTVSDEELLILKKILKLDGTIQKSKLGRMLDDLEKNYPGSKFGLFNSMK